MRAGPDKRFRQEAIADLSTALGTPRRLGDCHEWTSMDPGGQLRYRLTVFHDGPEGVADGWLFIPDRGRPERFQVDRREDVAGLAGRCAAAIPVGGTKHKAAEGRP